MTDIKLKPCPFCGKKQSEWSCDCACGNPALDSMTRGAWNTRPIEDNLRARAERAEAMVEIMIEAVKSLFHYAAAEDIRAWEALVAVAGGGR